MLRFQNLNSKGLRTILMSAVALTPMYAQAAAPAPQPAEAAVEEVVVTGTRIVREGYEAPTPLTVLGADSIEQNAAPTLMNMLATLPALSGSQLSSSANGASAITGGTQTANLRALGAARTLVLLDGHRTVGATLGGLTDIGSLPQMLVQRVDVVTGGASAVYGSDAVAGVLNFILDKQYTGVKAEISGGMTNYDDDVNVKADITAGFPFGGGRGHVLFSAERTRNWGVTDNYTGRDWAIRGSAQFANPAYTATNGQPNQIFVHDNASQWVLAPGGVILSGPLKGTGFGEGGVPFKYNFGSIVSTPYNYGGDWRVSSMREFQDMDAVQNNENIFARAQYDVVDNITAWAQWGFVQNRAIQHYGRTNIASGPTIKVDNAYLPASIRTAMQGYGLTQFQIGTSDWDLTDGVVNNFYSTHRFAAGLEGNFDALDTNWKWDATGTYGQTIFKAEINHANVLSRLLLASDAVTNAQGQIVCRITLTDPTNPCRPFNFLGTGVNEQNSAGRDYIQQYMVDRGHMRQSTLSASLNGEPFSVWAGPVSVSLSGEYRRDSVSIDNDAFSAVGDHTIGSFPSEHGKQMVKEVAVETIVPLAKDLPWAQNWDFSGAFRYTDYRTSGSVNTWKLGTTYAPIDDIKFRLTYSQDIRAPNLQDLFQGRIANTGSPQIRDPFENNRNYAIIGSVIVGNPALTPEKAKTTGIGAVFTPSFIPNFTASVDYWDVNIHNALLSIPIQTVVDLCYAGRTELCPGVIRTPAVIQPGQTIADIYLIEQRSINAANQDTKGLDVEASYGMDVSDLMSSWAGNVTIHGLATFYLRAYRNPGLSPPENHLGENAANGYPPNWKTSVTLTYRLDPFTVSLTHRAVSDGVINRMYIECTSGCPTSTTLRTTINDNQIPGRSYVDATFSYKFALSDVDSEAFFSVKNMFNVAPPPIQNFYGAFAGSSSTLYDHLGTVFRAGLRFKM